jgi:RNA-directed DNA polymerase
MKVTNVMERVYDPKRLQEAWQQVKRNAGAAGIDEMAVDEFLKRGRELGPLISQRLKEGTYRFKPAKRVYIPKPGSNKMRPLGIPVVMDRIVSQSINLVFEEIFAPDFTESNFGFRRGKSQHMAIEHVRGIVKEGYGWCVAVDLKSFFDEIPHDLILKLLRRKISDERLITLIARMLKAGVIVEGRFEKTEKGCPQGSPLSPMLSNIVLNELDHELEQRGLKYARWADDFIILVKSERAALRVLKGVTEYLEGNLHLPVNREKSEAAKVQQVTFLSFQISKQGKLSISGKACKKFREKVKALTKRNNPLSMRWIVQELNLFLRGWVNYFKIQDNKSIFYELDCWIRKRLRSMQLKKWKKPAKFQRVMIKAGFDAEEAKQTWIRMKSWSSADRWQVNFTLNLQWFKEIGLIFLNDFLQNPQISVV